MQQLYETSLGEDIKHVCNEIAFGILRQSKNWKIQLATLAFEPFIEVKKSLITQTQYAINSLINFRHYQKITLITLLIILKLNYILINFLSRLQLSFMPKY